MARVSKEDQTRERLHALAIAAQLGDSTAVRELTRVMAPMIKAQINKIGTGYRERHAEELSQVAHVGLYEAIARFDPEHNPSSFWSFAWWRIRAEITDYLAANAGALPVPHNAWHAAGKADQYADLIGREAMDLSDEELKEATDVRFARAALLARTGAAEIIEFDHATEADFYDDDDPTIVDEIVRNLANIASPALRQVAAVDAAERIGLSYESVVQELLRKANATSD